MKRNSLDYIKNILKTLIWPIIFVIGQFLIQYIFISIFNFKEQGSLTNSEFLKYIKTEEYINKLNEYINSNALFIVLITFIIFMPIFYNMFKKYKVKNNFKFNDIFIPILFGITISLIYNITLYNLNNVIYFTDIFKQSELPILVEIISSCICGPILEEILFRGIVYNKLKTFNKRMTAIIMCSIIFGIFHTNIIEMVYAFGLSFMFIYLYEKYKTLKAPILMHIALNTTIVLTMSVIVKNYVILNFGILIVSLIVLLILKKFIIKNV